MGVHYKGEPANINLLETRLLVGESNADDEPFGTQE